MGTAAMETPAAQMKNAPVPQLVFRADTDNAVRQAATEAQRLAAEQDYKVQEIVVFRYFDELEVKEISEQTGLSERTVARRLSQFLQRSRRLLADAQA